MGKGGQDSVRRKVTHESLTWEEVKRHTERNDKWLVIDGEVYDITEWSRRHPGGSKVISHFAGQDASVSTNSAICNIVENHSYCFQ